MHCTSLLQQIHLNVQFLSGIFQQTKEMKNVLETKKKKHDMVKVKEKEKCCDEFMWNEVVARGLRNVAILIHHIFDEPIGGAKPILMDDSSDGAFRRELFQGKQFWKC